MSEMSSDELAANAARLFKEMDEDPRLVVFTLLRKVPGARSATITMENGDQFTVERTGD